MPLQVCVYVHTKAHLPASLCVCIFLCVCVCAWASVDVWLKIRENGIDDLCSNLGRKCTLYFRLMISYD